MKSKIAAIMCLIMAIPSCSLLNPEPDGQRPPAEWERMAPIIQARVKYVIGFTFSMDKVKPHKEAVCQFADQLGTFLDSYDDRDASFDKLQQAVMGFVNQIQDTAVRDAVAVMVDMALTEAFAFAYKHYEGFINQDQTKVALIIAGAVADGVQDACGMSLSTMGAKGSPQGIFTTN